MKWLITALFMLHSHNLDPELLGIKTVKMTCYSQQCVDNLLQQAVKSPYLQQIKIIAPEDHHTIYLYK